MNDTGKRSSDFVQDLGDAIRKNPISAALIGMGAVWLFSSRGGKAVEASRDGWHGTHSAWRSGSHSLRDGAEAADGHRGDMSRAADRLPDAANPSSDSARDSRTAPDFVSELFEDTRENLSELFRVQPLSLGAVGLAIGAAVAASLPESELERSNFGKGSDFIKQKVGEIAGEQSQHALDIGKKVVDAMVDETREQGISSATLTAAASEFSGKIARVVGAAVPLEKGR